MNKREEKALWGLIAIIITGGLFLIYYAFKGIAAVIMSPFNAKKAEQRRIALLEKYNDAMLVSRLMNSELWTGQTAEQLIDSIGSPLEIDQKVLKTKKKEVWKYDHQGGNRFGLRITLDNDEVVGWDQKA